MDQVRPASYGFLALSYNYEKRLEAPSRPIERLATGFLRYFRYRSGPGL